jgi:hypothetical protein
MTATGLWNSARHVHLLSRIKNAVFMKNAPIYAQGMAIVKGHVNFILRHTCSILPLYLNLKHTWTKKTLTGGIKNPDSIFNSKIKAE